MQRVQCDISKLKLMLIHKIVQIERSKLHQENAKSQFKNVTCIIWQNVTDKNIPEENEMAKILSSYNGSNKRASICFA